jgi:hypothetical protein
MDYSTKIKEWFGLEQETHFAIIKPKLEWDNSERRLLSPG